MDISEVKELMAQFDQSQLREFSFKTSETELTFSKNEYTSPIVTTKEIPPTTTTSVDCQQAVTSDVSNSSSVTTEQAEVDSSTLVEGEEVSSPLVGVVYLSPEPDKPPFVSVGDAVTKGQTLVIIEAMKVMNEIPAPKDGIVTEIMVDNEEVVEFGQGLVRIK